MSLIHGIVCQWPRSIFFNKIKRCVTEVEWFAWSNYENNAISSYHFSLYSDTCWDKVGVKEWESWQRAKIWEYHSPPKKKRKSYAYTPDKDLWRAVWSSRERGKRIEDQGHRTAAVKHWRTKVDNTIQTKDNLNKRRVMNRVWTGNLWMFYSLTGNVPRFIVRFVVWLMLHFILFFHTSLCSYRTCISFIDLSFHLLCIS